MNAPPTLPKVAFKPVSTRPDRVAGDGFTDDQSRGHWRFTLTAANGRRMSGHFTGAVGEPDPPKLADLLECLAMDAASFLNARDLDDFAAELGYTKPSQAVRAFNACKRTAASFDRMGLDPFADWSGANT